jgi:hypothetical protein
VLIEAGAGVNARTASDGQTPLAWSSRVMEKHGFWDDRRQLGDEVRSRVEAIAALLRSRGGVE